MLKCLTKPEEAAGLLLNYNVPEETFLNWITLIEDRVITAIKEVRAFTNLGLKESKDFVDFFRVVSAAPGRVETTIITENVAAVRGIAYRMPTKAEIHEAIKGFTDIMGWDVGPRSEVWALGFFARLVDHLANEISIDWKVSKEEVISGWKACLRPDHPDWNGFIHPQWFKDERLKGRWTF